MFALYSGQKAPHMFYRCYIKAGFITLGGLKYLNQSTSQ